MQHRNVMIVLHCTGSVFPEIHSRIYRAWQIEIKSEETFHKLCHPWELRCLAFNALTCISCIHSRDARKAALLFISSNNNSADASSVWRGGEALMIPSWFWKCCENCWAAFFLSNLKVALAVPWSAQDVKTRTHYTSVHCSSFYSLAFLAKCCLAASQRKRPAFILKHLTAKNSTSERSQSCYSWKLKLKSYHALQLSRLRIHVPVSPIVRPLPAAEEHTTGAQNIVNGTNMRVVSVMGWLTDRQWKKILVL